jgi:hypothetical protein
MGMTKKEWIDIGERPWDDLLDMVIGTWKCIHIPDKSDNDINQDWLSYPKLTIECIKCGNTMQYEWIGFSSAAHCLVCSNCSESDTYKKVKKDDNGN